MGDGDDMPDSRRQDPGRVPPWWTDPTENVISLVEAAMKRQDDLREMQALYTARIGEMRETHATYVAELRSHHDRDLRQAESDRIDAIRKVDVDAVQRAAEVQAIQAQALAQQVVTTADAFRTSLGAALEPIIKDIADLRRAQYEAQGQKTQVVESRLNLGQLLAFGVLTVALLSLILLYVTKK